MYTNVGVPSAKDEAVAYVKAAMVLNAQLQKGHAMSSVKWNKHESIDDKLFDALGKLGD